MKKLESEKEQITEWFINLSEEERLQYIKEYTDMTNKNAEFETSLRWMDSLGFVNYLRNLYMHLWEAPTSTPDSTAKETI